jgi:NAD(P)-dependent dehydrogenase (short-subunit alcohol dehydrogenase family)
MPTNIDHYDLAGRRAVVVGADTPAGAAITDAFREADATVVAATGVTTSEEAGTAVERARDELGGLEIVVCATDHFLAAPIAETTDEELSAVVATNFTIPFAAARAAATALAGGDSGRLILVTHVLGERGVTNTSAYAAAHAATQSLVRTLSQELGPQGTVVNGISLGWMEWMQDRLDPGNDEAQRATRFPIMKRTGSPEDIGPMAVWLAGTGAGYVSGQVFTIDGGLLQHL